MSQSPTEPFEFTREYDGSLTVESAIGQALGAASVCWESMEKTGIFDSIRAKEISDALLELIPDDMPTPEADERHRELLCGHANLGLATTAELLDEIRARIEVDYYHGGGGLDYSTVKGRPDTNCGCGEVHE